MAEYVTHAVLRYLRRFDEYQTLQSERRWEVLDPHPRETFTVGVLGLGVLGAHVAQAVAAFGMPVRGYSRSARQIDGITTFAGEAQFDAFLDGVKVLVNLLPHTPDTGDVLNTRTFSKLAKRRVSDQRRTRRASGRTGSARSAGKRPDRRRDARRVPRRTVAARSSVLAGAAHHDHAAYVRADVARRKRRAGRAENHGADARRNGERRGRY